MEKLLPQNIEAECGVLGSIIIDPEAIVQVSDFLQPDDFYRDAHRTIYEVILQLYQSNEPADFITICDELERRNQLEDVGGASYITSLINQVPTSGNVEYYGHIVERTSTLRRLIHAAGKIAAVAYEEADADIALDKAEQLIFNISQRHTRSDFSSMEEILSDYMTKLEQLNARRGTIVGVPTGFTDLDRMTGGLQRSDLIILAARPGVGKTSMALSLAHNAALKYKNSVAVFSLEMSKEQLVQRLLSMDAGIDQQRLRTGWIEEEEWERIVYASDQLSEANIWIDDTAGISTMELRSKARRLQAEHGVDLIIVDYLQLMQANASGRSENRVQEVSEISRNLKGLARELNVPVMALSQLSRSVEGRQSKVPQLSDLRESGCITGESLIYLPDAETSRPIAELVGQTGFRVLALNTQTGQLEPREVTNAFATGRKQVYRLTTRLGRTIRATTNHRFLTMHDWQRLDELEPETPALQLAHLTGRKMQAASGNVRDSTGLDKHNLNRERAARLAVVAAPGKVSRLGQGNIYWEQILSIEADGEEEVYDLTVDGLHNFVANEFILHNSIEQDSDIVLFIYRDDVYNQDSERKNIADLIVAKHRNGPVGEISLYFQPSQTRFRDLEVTPIEE